jgi:HEAT repeat protein
MRLLVAFLCVGCLQPTAVYGAADKKTDVPALIKALKSTDPKKRSAAADDLGDLGAVSASETRDAVKPLIEVAKKDRDANVRKAAVTALGKIDPDPKQAVPALTAALKDKTAAVRLAAANALARMGTDAKDAAPDLEKAQNDKDRGVARAARLALRSVRGQTKK